MEKIIKALKKGTRLHGKLGEYVIDSVLGNGSFGITYKAKCKVKVENVTHIVNYAIKEFFISSICSREDDGTVAVNDAQKKNYELHRKAFVKEANMLYKLPPHEGIVKVNEYLDAYNTTYYVMEYLEESLTEEISSSPDGRLSESKAINLFVKISSAVSSLHGNNRLHLDIKPDNIMIKDGEPKLIDFGQSRVFDEYGSLINKDADSVCSDGYSPVEQYNGISHFMPSADVYALGATLFFMLTGERPVLSREMSPAFIDSKLPDNISEDTKQLLRGALAKDVNSRFKTIAEMLGSIGVIITTIDGSETRPVDGPHTHHFTGRELKIALGVLSLIAVVAILAFAIPWNTIDNKKVDVNDTTTVIKKDTITTTNNIDTTKTVTPKQSSDLKQEKKEEKKEVREIENKPQPTPSPSATLDYATWTGKIVNGKPHGFGTMTFTKSCRIPGTSISVNSSDVFKGTFSHGSMVNGELNGKYIDIEE